MSDMNEQERQRQWAEFQEFQKQQSKKGKKKWLWGCGGCLIVFIILATLFSACTAIFTGNNGDSNNSTKNESKEYKIGDTAKNGDLEVTVNSVETAKQVGPSALPETAKDMYVIADVTIKNNGKDSLTIDTNMFKLKSGDKTANADSKGSISANQSEDGSITDSFFLEQLNPESTTQGKVVFDVSENIANSDNKKLIINSRFFSSKNVIFNLKGDTKTSKKKDDKKHDDALVASTENNNNDLQQNVSTNSVTSSDDSDSPKHKTDNKVESKSNAKTINVNAQKDDEEMSQAEIDEWNRTKPTTHDESQMGYGIGDYESAEEESSKVWDNPNAHVGGPGWVGKGESYDSWAKRQEEVINSETE
ncbi:hypothetical protein SSCHL_0988 [Staphylococcus schleiferi]|nr:hypothetical protein SSCHL_0988 [Staphylococcus schleiferi]